MVAHPLAEAARALGEEISRAQGFGAPATATAALDPWESLLLSGPSLTGWPEAELRRDRLAWETGLVAPTPAVAGALPADLEATRRWEYRSLEAEQSRVLGALQAEESRKLASRRDQLVRERLGELANVGLDFGEITRPTEQGEDPDQAAINQRAAEQRAKILEPVKALMAEEERRSLERLLRAEEQLSTQTRESKARVDSDLAEEARRRRQELLPQLSEPRREMRARVEEFAGRAGLSGREATVPAVGLPPGAAADTRAVLGQTQAAYETARQRQLGRLIQARADLLRAIADDTRRAVARVAYADNLRLYLLPPAPAEGPDLTGQVQRRLAEIWSWVNSTGGSLEDRGSYEESRLSLGPVGHPGGGGADR